MQELRDPLEGPLPIFGVVANLDDHTHMSADVLDAVRQHDGKLVFNTVIPCNSKVEESHNRVAILYDSAPGSTGARADAQLVSEVIHRAEG